MRKRILAALVAVASVLPVGSASAVDNTYYTVDTSTYLHSVANTQPASRVETVYAGETLRIYCYYRSTYWQISGDYIWYHASAPDYVLGWVSGYRMNTGHDPNPNIRVCVYGKDY